MKTKLLLTALMAVSFSASYSTTWTINNSGFTFSPDVITINQGDSVLFSLGSIHNSREVSQSTWNANGSTALPGGWQTSNGGGLILPSQLTVGTHYYVCAPHASSGMKGTITVNPATGIENNPVVKGISFFPNPAKSVLTIESGSDLKGSSFVICDQSGKTLINGQLNNERQPIDISQLGSGIYFIRLNDDKSLVYRFVKE